MQQLDSEQVKPNRPSFGEFYKRIGFDEFPFSVYSSEEERGKNQKIFVEPSEFSIADEAFRNGRSMILVGDRGVGKTALLLDFHRKASEKRSLLIPIVNFGVGYRF